MCDMDTRNVTTYQLSTSIFHRDMNVMYCKSNLSSSLNSLFGFFNPLRVSHLTLYVKCCVFGLYSENVNCLLQQSTVWHDFEAYDFK